MLWGNQTDRNVQCSLMQPETVNISQSGTVITTLTWDCKYYLNTGLCLNQTLNTTSETLTYFLNL